MVHTNSGVMVKTLQNDLRHGLETIKNKVSMKRLQKYSSRGLLSALFCLLSLTPLQAQLEMNLQGELTGWVSTTDSAKQRQELGVRYLPQLKLFYPISETLSADGELTGNLYRTYLNLKGQEVEASHDEKAYRFWGRLYTDRFETRLGLQEISFGPGRILRSLRWFDQKDYRDPTGFTDGVKALLLRTYLDNNSNFWFWTLYGNQNPMGVSPLTPLKNRAEFGGRLQFPLTKGEIGFSGHQRQVNLNPLFRQLGKEINPLQENRLGLDLTWDLNIGVWLEYSLLELESNGLLPERQQFVTFGTDNTFDFGNGLGVTFELQVIHLQSAELDLEENRFATVALSLQYPLNLLDQIQFMGIHGYQTDVSTYQMSWQRVYDIVKIDLALFRSTSDSLTINAASVNDSSSSDETGLRLILQFNH